MKLSSNYYHKMTSHVAAVVVTTVLVLATSTTTTTSFGVTAFLTPSVQLQSRSKTTTTTTTTTFVPNLPQTSSSSRRTGLSSALYKKKKTAKMDEGENNDNEEKKKKEEEEEEEEETDNSNELKESEVVDEPDTKKKVTTKQEKDDSVVVEEKEKTTSKTRMEEFTNFIEEITDDVKDVTTTISTLPMIEQLSTVQTIGAITGRGEFATVEQQKTAVQAISELESMNPTMEPTNSELIHGTWELVYSTTQLFRSSPFFMAGRAVCQTEEEAKRYNWFCDMHRKALAISTIGSVRQIISSTRLISEFEVKVGSIPFLNDFTPFSYSGGLPLTIEGALVSSADITSLSTGTGYEIYMDTVEVKGSNVPILRQLLDTGMGIGGNDGGIKLQSRKLANLLESTVSNYETPYPIFETIYLDSKFRISRDEDQNLFVYVKTSNSIVPKDYSTIDSDLGILKLLEGFNDSITKFYL